MKSKKSKKNNLKPVNSLINKTHFLSQAAKRAKKINHAQQALDKVNIPLLKQCRILNFENANLLLGTESQSILARFHMQRSEILKTLRQDSEFCDLLTIHLKLFIEPMPKKEKLTPSKRDDIPDHLSIEASEKLSKLCSSTKQNKLKTSLTKLLAKHGNFKS